jgi:curved DNA-binding protein CbpA
MPGPLVPEDDLYARLEVSVDASPEAIELAWRALLKRHHPDVAASPRREAAEEIAKRINVAHDWLSDPTLRARYDRERLGRRTASARGGRGSVGVRYGAHPRQGTVPGARPTAPRRTPRVSRRPDLAPGDPSARLARFLDEVSQLTPDEMDRLAAAEPPPIAFLATIRRFVPEPARAEFEAAEALLAARVPRDRWAEAGLREGLLGVLAELVLSGFLDETLDEPFRGRARERLLRAWQASVAQPRYGPNSEQVVRFLARVRTLTQAEIAALVRASRGIDADEHPWPPSLDRYEDEALRISATLAARDAAAAVPVPGLSRATATRTIRLVARMGHVITLRHAYPPQVYETLTAPWMGAVTGRPEGNDPGPRPGVRRAT